MTTNITKQEFPAAALPAKNDQALQQVSSVKTKTPHDEWLYVESLDLEGQGVAHNSTGKVVFIEGALPTEEVQVDVKRSKGQWEMAAARSMKHESALRVKPRCSYYGICGGCAMQHLHVTGQIAIKQRVLEDNLWHLGKVKPDMILRPIEGPTWGYRWRTRLSVRNVHKKNKVLIGFREKSSRYVADMQTCEVLPADLSALLMPLRSLVGSLSVCDHIAQIEVAVGSQVIALVLRHLEPLTEADKVCLHEFAKAYNTIHQERQIEWWLQPKGLDPVHLLRCHGQEEIKSQLSYALPEFGLVMPYRPTDFTQVNPFVNQVLVSRALRCLDIQSQERVIDWFCGLGNFTLPISKQAKEVLGIEGAETLVERSRENAWFNGCHNTKFLARNLFEIDADELSSYGYADKWLIDPPREGAHALAKALVQVQQGKQINYAPPRRIVYVSCNPATLARDADLLVHQAGYHCSAAGMINMFAHTAHVESMAVFDYVG